jgi:nicotinamide-nucleotide amidase
MQAVIIAVGSELLTPARLDTNSLFLTERLARRGIEVIRKVVVGDSRGRIAAEIRRGRDESRIVIVTGGLGPTLDDLSREGAADALGLDLVEDPAIIGWLEQRFAGFGREMTVNNRRQAAVLAGAEILPNHNGTAPGQFFSDDGGIVMLLPGPPREIKPMFLEECEPRLDRIRSPFQYHTVSLRICGLGESDVDHRIGPIYSAESRAETTILAAPGDIQLHVRGRAANLEDAKLVARAVADKVAAELGDHVYSWDDEPLEVVVGKLLQKNKLYLGVAESCTGGLVSERITDVAGSSAYFAGGFVSYTKRAKVQWLGVREETIREHGVVSEATAGEMAERARDHAAGAGPAMGLSVTGVAGPEPDADGNPDGLVFLGVSDGAGTVVKKRQFGGRARDRNRQLAAQFALDLLRRRLLGLV